MNQISTPYPDMFPRLRSNFIRLASMLFNRMADIYEKDTKEAIKRFTALFEPAVILVMGVVDPSNAPA